MLTSGKYHLEQHAKVLTATKKTKTYSEKDIQSAFYSGQLLDVNQDDKEADETYHTTYLNPDERAKHDIEIHNGLLHQEGTVFDSSRSIAHNKPGYVAFTLNTNGALSVFEHLSGQVDQSGKRLAHSSMNAGAPVLCAGEMEIKQGKLIRMNTYSGHYQPSLYSVARFLEYLSDRGVDISETKVYLQYPPTQESGLRSKEVALVGDNTSWFEVPANDIVHGVKAIMSSNLNSLDDYLNSIKTILLRDVFQNDLTRAKSAIAKDFHDELLYALDTVKDSSSLVDIKASLECLESITLKYSEKLEKLEGKSGRLDSKFAKMKEQIKEVRDKLGDIDEDAEKKRIESFKANF